MQAGDRVEHREERIAAIGRDVALLIEAGPAQGQRIHGGALQCACPAHHQLQRIRERRILELLEQREIWR
jgi:hypothetical protein